MGKGEVALEAKPTLGHKSEGIKRRRRQTSADPPAFGNGNFSVPNQSRCVRCATLRARLEILDE